MVPLPLGIPHGVVEIFVFLDLEQNLAFFKYPAGWASGANGLFF